MADEIGVEGKTEAEVVAELKAEREQISGEILAEVAEIAKPVKVEAEVPAKVEEHKSDIFDGIANVIVAGEQAHRDGRTEDSLVVQIPKDGEGEVDIINVGQKELLADFHRVLDKEKVKYRDIVVEADVTENPEKIAKLRGMAQRQVKAAQATERRKALFEGKLGFPALPPVIESKLVEVEEKLPDLPGSEKLTEEGGQSGTTSE